MNQAVSRSLRVLVADDQPLQRRIATRMLRELGHSGVLVSDGEQALRALDGQTFDVVLMDATMPVLDGVGAVRALRARERVRAGRPRTPVIMVTAHDLPEDREHFRESGADGLVAKPLSVEGLRQELRRVLGV